MSILEKDLKEINCETETLNIEVNKKLNRKASFEQSIMTQKNEFSEQQRRLLENERNKNEGLDSIEKQRKHIGKADSYL